MQGVETWLRGNGFDQLRVAVINGRLDDIRDLLAQGAQAAAHSDLKDRHTLLHVAVSDFALRGRTAEIVGLLVAAGANVHAEDGAGQTPLHWAARNGFCDGCRALLAHGADVNYCTDGNDTPLWRGARSAGPDLVRILLDAGADASLGAGADNTPLHAATTAGNVDVCRALVEAGASPSCRPESPKSGYLTPCQQSVADGQSDVVRYFIEECGEPLDQTTHDGRTLFDLARAPQIAGFLLAKKTEMAVRGAIGNEASRSGEKVAKPVPIRSRGLSPL